MSDLISRQAAIKKIEWWFGILKQNPDILIDVIKTLPSAQQWIPVSERFPEESGMYFVTIQYHNDFIGSDMRWYFEGHNAWESDEWECVLAWMPLIMPEPYKGGER